MGEKLFFARVIADFMRPDLALSNAYVRICLSSETHPNAALTAVLGPDWVSD